MPIENEISESQIKKINLLDKFREITQREYNPYEEIPQPEGQQQKRKGPWKKNVAPPSTNTPWPIIVTPSKPLVIDPTKPDFGLGAERLAWTEGSRIVRGHKTSLKKMGLKGQPKPELAMTEERVENRLYGQVISTILRSDGKKVPSFDKFLSDNQPEQFKSNNPIHRQRLIDLYGEKEGRKFWKADVEADHDLWKKKQKEIWKYAKEFEKNSEKQ